MKKVMLVAAILIASVAASAQNEVGKFSIAPTIGINLSNASFSVSAISTSTKAGLVIGATGEYGILPKFSVSAALLYSMEGCKCETEGEQNGYDYKISEDVSLNYLNIPIMANYYVWQGLAVKAGLQFGINLSSDDDYEMTVNGIAVPQEHITEFSVNSLNLSFPIGVSYEYKNFVVDARYNLGLSKIVDESGMKGRVFQITAGYKFSL